MQIVFINIYIHLYDFWAQVIGKVAFGEKKKRLLIANLKNKQNPIKPNNLIHWKLVIQLITCESYWFMFFNGNNA